MVMAFLSISIVACFIFLVTRISAVNNGLARTPPMGWDNWNAFGCSLQESLILETAEKIAASGLRDVGYKYVILDDCWSNGRNASGALKPNMTAFPKGMQDLGNRLHAMDLKFGMYSSAGVMTCAKYDGSLGHEEIDAKTFAGWGVDFLKYDNCFNQGQSGTDQLSFDRYQVMSKALNSTGRPILYNMCNWGEDGPWKWAATIANSWRISGDITNSFDRSDPRCPCSYPGDWLSCTLPGFHCSTMNLINKLAPIADKGFPGGWNDMDALEIGNGGMTDGESITMMTMWAVGKSQLVMGADIRTLSPQAYSIYTNPAILAINQDPQGQSAFQRWRYLVADTDENGQGEIQMWSGNLANSDMVVVLLNAGNQDRSMNATLADIFLDEGGSESDSSKKTWDFYDLWANRMPDSLASALLSGNTTLNATEIDKYYYNATKTPYADGIANRDSRLMGVKVGSVGPQGTITAKVESHSVKAYRMQSSSSNMRRSEL